MNKIIIFIFLIISFAYAYTDESTIRKSYREECEQIIKYGDLGYEANCFYNYHHFNVNFTRNYKSKRNGTKREIQIAGFNALHPGMSKTRYKDYKKIATMIRQWDIIAVTELLPLVSGDLRHNKKLVKFIKDSRKKISQLSSQRQNIGRSTKKYKELTAKLTSLKRDIKKAPSLYRLPGYLKILKALRSVRGGKKWSLVLSPRGQAAKETDVQELVGYFYNSEVISPSTNIYCKEIKTKGHGEPVACIPSMGSQMLGTSKKAIFSRRPFFITFKSARTSFNLLSSHVVYNSPKDPKTMSYILRKSFNVDHYSELSTGVTSENYARFAEMKITLEFMNALTNKYSYKMKNLIYVGDTNLSKSNPFWSETLKAFQGSQVYGSDKTTLSEARINIDGEETNGLANDYDHFIFNPELVKSCVRANTVKVKAYNFLKGKTATSINKKYLVRTENYGSYDERKYRELLDENVIAYDKGEKFFQTIGTKKILVDDNYVSLKGIINDSVKNKKFADGFQERILNSQLNEKTHYTLYKQTISDHLPIYIKCNVK